MTFFDIPHTDRSTDEKALATGRTEAATEDVWNADERGGRAGIDEGDPVCWTGIDAVAMERRERIRSRGYVVPSEILAHALIDSPLPATEVHIQTEVMPANAPLIRRVWVSSSLAPYPVNH